jgi:cysteine desulfuration protein SufE
MDEALKTDDTLVRGCTSRVWLIAQQGGDGRYHFTADSDAQIVRGLVYVLMIAYQDKNAAEIAAVDIDGAFERLGLSGHLSPSRRNGFFAMVQRIRALAA